MHLQKGKNNDKRPVDSLERMGKVVLIDYKLEIKNNRFQIICSKELHNFIHFHLRPPSHLIKMQAENTFE